MQKELLQQCAVKVETFVLSASQLVLTSCKSTLMPWPICHLEEILSGSNKKVVAGFVRQPLK